MKKIIKSGIVFFIGIFCLLPVHALNVVQPTEMFYVNDSANVVSQDVENHIVNYNDVLFEETGAQLVIVTVDFLNGASINDYAYELFNQWRIGTNGNGILVLLAIGEEDYYCMTGSAIAGFISDSSLSSMLQTYLEPDFASGDYSNGVYKIFNALYEKLENYYGFTYQGSSNIDNSYNNSTANNNYNSAPNKTSFVNTMIIVLISVVVIGLLIVIIARPRSNVEYVYGRPRRRWVFFGPRVRRYRPPRPPRQPTPPRQTTTAQRDSRASPISRPRSGGGGTTRGSGIGRSSVSSSRSSSASAGRSSSAGRGMASGRPTGGMRSGGGGFSRGGGAGRK